MPGQRHSGSRVYVCFGVQVGRFLAFVLNKGIVPDNRRRCVYFLEGINPPQKRKMCYQRAEKSRRVLK